MKQEDFDAYIRQVEPSAQESADAWNAAIGLQAVDGLKPSTYLLETAMRNIEGDITIDEVRQLLDTYYRSKTTRTPEDEGTEEADKVAANIKKILSSKTIAFNTNGLISIHRRIFDGVFKHAGETRKYDISKKEWILKGDSVNYLNWEDIRRALDYDINQERLFSYKGLTEVEKIKHISQFVSGLWQIHPFSEGNTRTTAVFAIQYLRSIGYKVNNDMFAKYSWYFRNALVRANYKSSALGIDYTYDYLEKFFRNLLMGENHELKNRYMLVNAPAEWTSTEQVENKHRTSTEQVPNKLSNSIHIGNADIAKLVVALGTQEMSVKQMMEAIGLKHRPTFLDNYLNPSIANGYVRLLYPDSPRHPRQKYLLTVKGLAAYREIKG